MKRFIGRNLFILLNERNMSQSDLAKLAGIDQSTISKIISDKQSASPASIKSIALALKVDEATLTNTAAPIFHSENQQGGQANNYFLQNGEALVSAKDETIAVLKSALSAAEKREAVLLESIEVLKKALAEAEKR
jgi:transcriptional regulator with XRE-family HTH domain